MGAYRIDGNLYFAAPIGGGLIKIGRSCNVLKRVAHLAEWSPVDLEILATVRGTLEDEHRVHYRFRDLWVRHEWFTPAPELLAFIAAVEATGELPADDTPRKLIANWRSSTYRSPPGAGSRGNPSPAAERRTDKLLSLACTAARVRSHTVIEGVRREREFKCGRSA